MRTLKYFFAMTAFLILAGVLPQHGLSKTDNKGVYVIPIEGEIEKGLTSFLTRAIHEAETNHADLIIFDIDTPGGSVESASEIGKLIKGTAVKKTIAFVDSRALSAGSYISLNANEIYMVPNATMGASAIIDQKGNAAGKKAESYWRAAMKSAAEQNGRNPLYAVAMADESVDLPKYDAGKGELLTLTAQQAEEVKYSEGTVKNLDGLLKEVGFANAKVHHVDVSFAEKFARFLTNPIVVPILLTVASLGLVIELYSPGFGIPGTMGIVSLVLFFYGHLVAGLAGYESIVLFIIGIVLIVLEFFLPGAVAGILGIAAVLGSLFLASGNVKYMGISILIAITITIIGMVVMVKVFGKKMKLFKKIILSDSTNTESGYVSNVNRLELIGRIGLTKTPLRPSGTIMIDDERIDAVSEGGYIGKDVSVIVMKVEGSRIIVRETLQKESPASRDG
ncbi:NfeD family protein [Falsibacillus albus]|uniref:Nodulation protein NfeD n=1 Tax=Falsibacillus albus TaxID=2478915 RepID=A0A3L7K563_9BACI|nr:nodulation protein NfeD [Falsibacillus albus]RLQ98177.1 nodulation protein NfeD [Falsibacillus albus]